MSRNPDIDKLRSVHRVCLARVRKAKIMPRTLQVGHTAENAEQFWLGSNILRDYRDILLRAIMVVGLNQGLRNDEIQKLTIGSVTEVPGSSGEGSLYYPLKVAIKNSTISRTDTIREWPGERELRLLILLDLFIALLTWMMLRGNRPGYLFCDVNHNNMISSDKPWSAISFHDFFRERLRMCGVGSDDTLWYAGHSIKHGSVQLYRSIGVRDEQICVHELLCSIQRLPNSRTSTFYKLGTSSPRILHDPS